MNHYKKTKVFGIDDHWLIIILWIINLMIPSFRGNIILLIISVILLNLETNSYVRNHVSYMLISNCLILIVSLLLGLINPLFILGLPLGFIFGNFAYTGMALVGLLINFAVLIIKMSFDIFGLITAWKHNYIKIPMLEHWVLVINRKIHP